MTAFEFTTINNNNNAHPAYSVARPSCRAKRNASAGAQCCYCILSAVRLFSRFLHFLCWRHDGTLRSAALSTAGKKNLTNYKRTDTKADAVQREEHTADRTQIVLAVRSQTVQCASQSRRGRCRRYCRLCLAYGG